MLAKMVAGLFLFSVFGLTAGTNEPMDLGM
jgi:hypothetical protein